MLLVHSECKTDSENGMNDKPQDIMSGTLSMCCLFSQNAGLTCGNGMNDKPQEVVSGTVSMCCLFSQNAGLTCGSSVKATATGNYVWNCILDLFLFCSFRMLDPDLWEQYDHYKLAYSNILYNWRLFNQRAVILKSITTTVPQHKGLGKFTHLSLPAGWFTVKFITTVLHQHKGVAKFTDLSPFVKFITTTKIRPALGNSLSPSRGAGRTTGCTICLSGQKFCIIYFLPSPILPPLVMHVW